MISNQICFGFQSDTSESKTKTDSITYYLEKSNALKAIEYARKKSNSYLENKNYAAYCDIMIEKSEIYRNFNDNENALKVLFEARDVAEKNKLIEKQVLVYRGIGNINGVVFEYTKAKKYLRKAEKIASQLNNNDLLSKVNQGLFKIYFETQSDSAEYYVKKVAFYTAKSGNLNEKRKNHSNFYSYYTSKNLPDLAKKHVDSSYAISIRQGDKNNIAEDKGNLGVYYMTVEKNYAKGIKEYNEIIKMFPNDENTLRLSNAYLNI